MGNTRVEVVFRRGRPVAAFFHLKKDVQGKSGRQIMVRPQMTAHFDDGGHPVGLEIQLPDKLDLLVINDVLRELGADPVVEADLAPLRMG
jgi:hypothetical protein